MRYVWDMCGVRYANNLLKNPATKRLSGKTYKHEVDMTIPYNINIYIDIYIYRYRYRYIDGKSMGNFQLRFVFLKRLINTKQNRK